MTPWLVALIAIVVVVLLVAFARRRRRSSDTVRSFQRQIDALSPEARRPVVDQVQRIEHDGDARERPGSVRPTPSTETPDSEEPDGQGGTRGS